MFFSSGHIKGSGEADHIMYSTGTCSMRQGCQQCRLQARCKSEWVIIVWCQMSNFYTPRKHSLGGVYRNRPVCPSVCLSRPTSTCFVRFPPNFVEFKIMMCELLQYKGFYCPLSFTPAISRQKHVTFIEIIMSTLYRTNTQRGIFILLTHRDNSLPVDMLLHSDTFFLFQTIQYLLLLLNAACIAEKQQIPILLALAWPDHDSNTWSTTPQASTPTLTPQMRSALVD